MKIMYFGTVCNLPEYERLLQKCKQKPTIATINFEASLLEGLEKNNADIDVFSFPMIPVFPKSKCIYWGNKKEVLSSGYKCTWIKTLNLPILKQLSRSISGKKIIKKYLHQNNDKDCVILMYSLPPFLVKSVLKYSHKHNVNCYAIIPDLPKNMYINSKTNGITRYLQNRYLSITLKRQGNFDGYIYLTEEMSNEINPVKPYIVMEGIANINLFNEIKIDNKGAIKSIMYAGRLNERYGIFNLISAFKKANVPNCEMWIFGNGNAENELKEIVEADARIHFFGRRSLKEVLEYEKRATLLVNPRSTKEDFTRFSFPSKTIEYMMSGTPLLTTKLPGIPQEYYKHVYSVEDNDIQLMADAIKKILCKPKEELNEFGNSSSQFIIEEKNAKSQANRILSFITALEENNANNS